MPIQSPQELLAHKLQKIQDAETQASQALQQMSQQVEDDQLRQLLDRRMQQGQQVLQDVQSAMQRLGGQAQGGQNAAAQGLIQEAQELLQEVQTPEMRQAVIIAGVQGLQHYCIAAWGTVKAMAREVGEQELAQAMQRAVEEGYSLDEEMSALAESRANPEALEGSDQGAFLQQAASDGPSQGGQQQASTGETS
jgi:ferritin-like metal-binding protein YciE